MVYYDLNLDSNLLEHKLKSMLLLLTKYGYDSVAITNNVEGKIGYKDICKIKKINLEDSVENSCSSGWLRISDSNKSIKQYTRLQVTCKTLAEFQMINTNNPVVASYDIVSVVPCDVSVFNACCNSNDIDIITIDLNSKFVIRPERVRQCIAKGIFIEILYGNLFSKTDSERASFFQIASSLIRSSFGKNIILSSNAQSSTFLRSPYDLSNLGHLFGLTFDQAKASVSKHPHTAVLHALTRRTKGIATVTDPHLLKDLELWKLERKDDITPTGNTKPHEKHTTTTTTTTTTTVDPKTTTTTTPTTTTKKPIPTTTTAQPIKPIAKNNNKKPENTNKTTPSTQQTKMDLDDNNKRKRE